MAEVLKCEVREGHGKRNAKRLRKAGSIPAVLYGHGEGTVSLAVPADQMQAALRHGSRLIELQGAVNQSALVRELQWDVYGVDVLHVDFARVSKDERIAVNVRLELRGSAPGAREGGVVEQYVHELHIETVATSIPEKIQVNINHLNLNESITAGQIALPEGVKLVSEPDLVVVQCVVPAAEEAAEPLVGETAEPEVIGRKAEEEQEEG